jgi:hypothetical protein
MIGSGAWRSGGVVDVAGLGNLSCMHAPADYYAGLDLSINTLLYRSTTEVWGRVLNDERKYGVPARGVAAS